MKKVHLHSGVKFVLRKIRGRWFAAAFEKSLTDRQIDSRMRSGTADFFPFKRSTWEFDWSRGTGRVLHIRR